MKGDIGKIIEVAKERDIYIKKVDNPYYTILYLRGKFSIQYYYDREIAIDSIIRVQGYIKIAFSKRDSMVTMARVEKLPKRFSERIEGITAQFTNDGYYIDISEPFSVKVGDRYSYLMVVMSL